jgi:23S rRNA (pseudouridine1915-N3)-methyltransferase
MKCTFLALGKTDEPWLKQGIDIYRKRLERYINLEWVEYASPKKWSALPPEQLMAREAEVIEQHMSRADFVVLLDEHGKMLRSVEFSAFLQQRMNQSVKNLLFVVGGAWGFHPGIHKKAHLKLSLSPMTFSHQMIRPFFAEQLYRAFTILRNEAYHNE